MDAIVIAVYAGKILDRHHVFSVQQVQEAILNDENVKKVVPVEDIIFTMGMLVEGGYIEKINDQGCGTYRSFVRLATKKKIEEGIIRNNERKQRFSSPPSSSSVATVHR